MELVLLSDMQASYASNWVRVANTEGLDTIRIKDRFREQGFGPGSEELQVDGIDISPVGGFSRLFFVRAANATQPEVHRLGAVLHLVGIAAEETVPKNLSELAAVGQLGTAEAPYITNASGDVAAFVVTETITSTEMVTPVKRRGRPPGSKNKAKDVAIPGF